MNTLALMFLVTTQALVLPQGLLSALCYVESHHQVKSTHINDGGSNSVGVCQLKLSTARQLGFKGSEKELLIPNTNIYYAGKYLALQLNRYNGDIVKGIAAYNAGTHRFNPQGLTMNRKYVRKVFVAWSENK